MAKKKDHFRLRLANGDRYGNVGEVACSTKRGTERSAQLTLGQLGLLLRIVYVPVMSKGILRGLTRATQLLEIVVCSLAVMDCLLHGYYTENRHSFKVRISCE